MTTLAYGFTYQPEPDLPALRQAALALLSPDAPAQPWEVSDPADAGDTAIECGDRVSVFPPGAWEPRIATVQAVRGDGQLLVHYAFGATKWAREQDVTLLIKRAAAELGEVG